MLDHTRNAAPVEKSKRLDLSALLSPRSVAIVGASAAGGRANGVIRNLVDLGYEGPIYPVNPKYSTIMDLPCFPSISDLPTTPDCVAIGIPGEKCLTVLEEAHRKGARAAVIFASGFGEAGDVGKRLQRQLEEFIARTGMLVCGPNCLGVVNMQARSCAYSSITPKHLRSGGVAVVSQSGSVVVALVRNPRGMEFSYLVSSGNEVGVSTSDYLHHFAADPHTRVLAAFMEDIKQPANYIAAAEVARRQRKPVIVVKTGRSEIGSAASAAHSGSLAGSYDVQSAIFRQKGIVHCADLDEWIEAIQMFELGRPPAAKGVGIIGVSGGENALLLDHAAECGLEIPALSAAGQKKLSALLPWYARGVNPIDATGNLASDPDLYLRCLEILAEEPSIGVIIVSQDSPAVFDKLAAEAVAEIAKRSGKCFVYLNNFSAPFHPEFLTSLRDAGVPYLQGLREGLKAVKAFIEFHDEQDHGPSPAYPKPNPGRRQEAIKLLKTSTPYLCEDVGKSFLALYGFEVSREIRARSVEGAVQAASALGFPVAAKILSPAIAHKMDIGGVRLNLETSDDVAAAYEDILRSVSKKATNAPQIEGILVQQMVGGAIELFLGMKHDAHFGCTVAFGLGGTFVEILRSVALRVAPLSEADVMGMIREIKPLAGIMRKLRPDLDYVSLLARLLSRLSTLVGELGPQIAEIDINPVIFNPVTGSLVVVDALIVPRSEADA